MVLKALAGLPRSSAHPGSFNFQECRTLCGQHSMIELEEIREQRFLTFSGSQTHLGIGQNLWTLSLED